ncbi:T9SS type B sorting domain-containing protein [Flavobacterium arsenatis]|uniref:T9SS type B sorting domain-containing protein n=1 Tax=Flavobacterium arsenatis TaxID=1484332 RepID=UPI00286D5CB2|nr:T9SS type B sorting domain-containing protein [Flavobacterium arsenatis]
MRKILKEIVAFLFLLLTTNLTYGQLGFCLGSKGLPIFNEDFGSGTTFGPQLPAGTTSYNYVSGTPNDGDYTISSQINLNNSWHNSQDHTPGDTNGKSLIVNASFTSGEFYKRTVTGLCVNTTFEFTAWLMNIYNSASVGACPGTGIPINVTFEIWDATETTLLESGSTGDINGTPTPIWEQFGLTFTTLAGQTSVVLIMKNNGAGGCGNDLAIDDIMFRSCGDFTIIATGPDNDTSFRACQDQLPTNISLNVFSEGTNLNVYQWQESDDNTIWTDIIGETTDSYVPTITATKFFRVKVAEDIANLANPFCFTVSEVFTVTVIPKPIAPPSNGNANICEGQPIPALSVTPATGEQVNWFDAPSAGNLLQANSTTFTPTLEGTYYAEAFVPNATCVSDTRTAVSFSVRESPIVTDGSATFCQGTFVNISAEIDNVDYLWSTGETTKTIRVTSAGTYTVTVTNDVGCSNVRTVTVSEILVPVIDQIIIDHRTVTITTTITGDYEYALDGLDYQDSNVFNNVIGGVRTAFVRNRCGRDIEDFDLIILPKFFTPNGDGYNDTFQIEGNSMLPKVKIAIFDRQGALIIYLDERNSSWDGTFNGNLLPATDYWYKANFTNGSEMKGHFSLIR